MKKLFLLFFVLFFSTMCFGTVIDLSTEANTIVVQQGSKINFQFRVKVITSKDLEIERNIIEPSFIHLETGIPKNELTKVSYVRKYPSKIMVNSSSPEGTYPVTLKIFSKNPKLISEKTINVKIIKKASSVYKTTQYDNSEPSVKLLGITNKTLFMQRDSVKESEVSFSFNGSNSSFETYVHSSNPSIRSLAGFKELSSKKATMLLKIITNQYSEFGTHIISYGVREKSTGKVHQVGSIIVVLTPIYNVDINMPTLIEFNEGTNTNKIEITNLTNTPTNINIEYDPNLIELEKEDIYLEPYKTEKVEFKSKSVKNPTITTITFKGVNTRVIYVTILPKQEKKEENNENNEKGMVTGLISLLQASGNFSMGFLIVLFLFIFWQRKFILEFILRPEGKKLNPPSALDAAIDLKEEDEKKDSENKEEKQEKEHKEKESVEKEILATDILEEE